tara:strand:- start:6632 stop:7582 length:951 start_codon:yes stop_codon:yes gene_type:complete
MKKKSYIFLAGHKGLVGSSLLNLLKRKGYKNIITVDKKKLNLRDYKKVKNFFKNKKIEYLIMAAARAGGIIANSSNQKDFFLENVEIQNSLLQLALDKKVKRTIYLGTSCIYPKFAKNPISENSLLTGELEKTNQCYAIAKISGIKLSEALFQDYKLNIICLMPTNVYGNNDNFDKINGHVIPAMVSKFIEAKKKSKKIVKLLGTGKPIREFIHSDDLAEAILKCLNVSSKKMNKIFRGKLPILNVGTGENIKIINLAKIISKFLNYRGIIRFDKRFPDGTYKKNLNSTIIKKLGWRPRISLKNGLKEVILKQFNT